ncbi:MAG TPA: FkbM family methyltransferase [Anaeromyxobacteraceae bacterium]|nr:FkbM family methyltransferase [Anaeromyxobacteraceae bacterium]
MPPPDPTAVECRRPVALAAPLESGGESRLRFLWRAWRCRLRDDRAELRWILARLRPGQVALDVGAHKGGYTWWMQRAVGPGGCVVAFEPQARIAARLADVLARSGCGHVRVENLALSDRSGDAVLVQPSGATCAATLEPRERVRASERVRVVTLDGWLERNGDPAVHLVKCDVEGHELAVFRGARRTLERHRPALLVEIEARHRPGGSVAEVVGHLESLGYRASFFWKGRQLPVSAFRPELHQVPGRRPYANDFAFEPA